MLKFSQLGKIGKMKEQKLRRFKHENQKNEMSNLIVLMYHLTIFQMKNNSIALWAHQHLVVMF